MIFSKEGFFFLQIGGQTSDFRVLTLTKLRIGTWDFTKYTGRRLATITTTLITLVIFGPCDWTQCGQYHPPSSLLLSSTVRTSPPPPPGSSYLGELRGFDTDTAALFRKYMYIAARASKGGSFSFDWSNIMKVISFPHPFALSIYVFWRKHLEDNKPIFPVLPCSAFWTELHSSLFSKQHGWHFVFFRSNDEINRSGLGVTALLLKYFGVMTKWDIGGGSRILDKMVKIRCENQEFHDFNYVPKTAFLTTFAEKGMNVILIGWGLATAAYQIFGQFF